MQDYGVVYSGRLCEGMTQDEVRDNLSRLLGITEPDKLRRLFTGKPLLLKKGLSADEAARYEKALRKAGAVCELRRLPAAPQPAVPAPVATASPAVPAPALSLNLSEPAAPAARPMSLEALALVPAEDRPPPASPAATAPVPQPTTPRETHSEPAGAPEPAMRSVVVKGSGAGYGDLSIIPDEVRGLCWGGFFMPWLWGSFNGVTISFLALPGLGILRRVLPRPVVLGISLLMSLFMLIKGRELAWQNKNWDSAEHFNRVQRRWTIAGLCLTLVLALLIPSCMISEKREQRRMAEALQAEAASTAAAEARAREEYLNSIQDPLERAKAREQLEAEAATMAAEE